VLFNPRESVVKNLVIAMYAATRIRELKLNGVLVIPFDDDDSSSSHYCDRLESFNFFMPFFTKRFGVRMEFIGYQTPRYKKILEIITWGGEKLYIECANASCFSRSEDGTRCGKCDKCKVNGKLEKLISEIANNSLILNTGNTF